MQQLILKSGETFTGYWNGKVYNTTVYFSVSADGTKAGINWKQAKKFDRSEIKSISNINDNHVSKHDVNEICPHCHTRCYGDCQS